MRLNWIIEALQAFANRLWSGSRRQTSRGSSIATDPSSAPSHSVPDDAGTNSERLPANETSSGDLDHDDGTSEEQPDSGHIDDESGATNSSNTLSKPSSDSKPVEQGSPGSNSESTVATAFPADDDQECSQQETDGHSEADAFEGDRSTEQARKSKCKPPRNIGRRRGEQSTKKTPEPQSPSSRPELICRRVPASATWEIILIADEECQLAAVHLEDKPLDHTEQECRVSSFTGSLTVFSQNTQKHEVPLFKDDPLIFKLRKNWFGEGRKIARITNGHFIVIAPATWERIGHMPVEPDGCADTEFQAHYFYRDASAIDESVDGFRDWSDSLVATGIELTGQRVFDDSDEGDLFVGAAPSLNSSSGIVWARVGEEIEHGWGLNFLPDKRSLPEVLDGREGRFFLRVYDSETRLLDSTAFRYISNLKQIRTNGTDYSRDLVVVPTPTGHSTTEICFVSADGSMISPILPTEALQTVMPSGTLLVPPYPDADRILCRLGTDRSGVDIVLDLPRIWWRLEDGRSDPSEWQDTPIVMTRKEFRKHAHSNVSMVILSTRFETVRVGFDDEQVQPYRRLIENDRITFPLAHFVDHKQIDRKLHEDVHFNVEWADEIVPLILISADPMPEILSITAEPATIFAEEEVLLEWKTRNADDARVSIDPDVGVVESDGTFTVRPTETTRYTLTLAITSTESISGTVTVTVEQPHVPGKWLAASVMSTGGGWRSGKGFSFRELQDAGVKVQEVVERAIPIDRRRRTSHRANVERVRSMFDG